MHESIPAGQPPALEATPLHVEEALDEALEESFPASDPVAIDIAAPDDAAPSGSSNA